MRYRIFTPSQTGLTALLLLGFAVPQSAQAQPTVSGAGIFSCVDARGRNLTSDRPIAECSDREQRELNPSGTTRRRIEPTYTARQQTERELVQRDLVQRELRSVEDRRRDRALLARYPSATTHQRACDEATAQVDSLIDTARKRIDELLRQRQLADEELQFYTKDVSKAPELLRRQIVDNSQNLSIHNRFLGDQEEEKKRVTARLDEERTRLRPLWAGLTAATPR